MKLVSDWVDALLISSMAVILFLLVFYYLPLSMDSSYETNVVIDDRPTTIKIMDTDRLEQGTGDYLLGEHNYVPGSNKSEIKIAGEIPYLQTVAICNHEVIHLERVGTDSELSDHEYINQRPSLTIPKVINFSPEYFYLKPECIKAVSGNVIRNLV